MHAHRLLVPALVRSALVLAARLALVAGGAVRPAAPRRPPASLLLAVAPAILGRLGLLPT